jgi:crotonobetainyl-CoA:carnitine CoA-transferase CaiB-like acyl-CoA transferase
MNTTIASETNYLPLAGVRVIDLTTVVFGPLTTQIFADYGADVIKIESPEGDIMRHAGSVASDGMGCIFLNLNRGKRSVVLDLKTQDGREVLRKLISTADVFIHNVRRSAMDRLDLSYEAIAAINPRILYCTATGFAKTNTRADAAAIDDVIQTSAGLAALNAGDDGVPRFVQSLLADKVAGMGLACAVLAALYRRETTGRGGLVDVPMYETFACFMLLEHLQGESYEPARGKVGYQRVMSARGRRIYKAKDGYVAMTPYSSLQWAHFFRETGRPELIDDLRVTDAVVRNAHIGELYDIIDSVAGTRTVTEWEALATRLGFPSQRVNSLADVAADPDLLSTGALIAREHTGIGMTRMLASPGFFDGKAARHTGVAPRFAEHTLEILTEAGFSTQQIERFVVGGAVYVEQAITSKGNV